MEKDVDLCIQWLTECEMRMENERMRLKLREHEEKERGLWTYRSDESEEATHYNCAILTWVVDEWCKGRRLTMNDVISDSISDSLTASCTIPSPIRPRILHSDWRGERSLIFILSKQHRLGTSESEEGSERRGEDGWEWSLRNDLWSHRR